jgi:hypothetical protein
MPPRTAPNSVTPEAKLLWEDAVRLIERLPDAEDREQRRALGAELTETLKAIVFASPYVDFRPTVFRLGYLANPFSEPGRRQGFPWVECMIMSFIM